MKKLSNTCASLLRDMASTCGSFESDNLYYIEEELTFKQYSALEKFLEWLTENNKTFGSNVKEVYAEFVSL